MLIIKETKNINEVMGLILKLWPDCSNVVISDEKTSTFLAYKDETAVGFAMCSIRYDYVEGTKTSPVGYLEGIFVEKEYKALHGL